MSNIRLIKIYVFVLLCFISLLSLAQKPVVIDGVIAIVGNKSILRSEIENQYSQYQNTERVSQEKLKCSILEEMMFQKLLLIQAGIDSVKITDQQVEEELDKRLRYFIRQLGSKERLEEYYKKPLVQIKSEFKEVIRDLLYSQTVEAKITKDLKITPSEVKVFFKKLPQDSIPLINSEIEVAQIVKQPPISIDEKRRIKDKLNEVRERIIAGEAFSTLAVLYSDDIETSKKGGEVGTRQRADLTSEIEAVVFKLKPIEVSSIIETKDGFCIFQLIERKGDYINYRQILFKPKVLSTDLIKAKLSLDSIYSNIMSGKIKFDDAVAKYSDDPNKANHGLIVNQNSGTNRFEMNEIDQDIFNQIDKIKIGEISPPSIFKQEDGRQAYRILFLKFRSEPHRANMKDDYDKIQTAALNQKKNDIIDDWIKSKSDNTYIKLIDEYKSCSLKHKWSIK